MSLKQKTIQGFSWVFFEKFLSWGVQFIFGIILARLLTPEEYGLIGMLAIFLVIADTFVIAGYGEALIRKKDATAADYSTVFWINIGTALFFYVLLYLLAPQISDFFNEPILRDLILVINLVIIIDALGMVPGIPLFRSMDFKTLSKVTVFANAVSGVIAIILAFLGFGVWSLVWRRLVFSVVKTVSYNLLSRTKIQWLFSRASFKELFGFGWKLLVTRLIAEIFQNIYYIVIGKYFSARELGLFTRANGYKDMPSKMLTSVFKSVSYPALSQIHEDNIRLKKVYRKMIQGVMYLTFAVMLGLAASADNFIIGLIGTKWKEAIPYLQLLCLAGIFFPLTNLNLNVMVVKGRSDLNLIIEIVRRVFAIPVIIIGIIYGIKALIIGMVVSSCFDYLVAAYWTSKLIDYSLKEQLLDIVPSLLMGILLGGFVLLIGKAVLLPPLILLLIQAFSGLSFILLVSHLFQLQPYIEMKAIIFSKFNLSKA